MQETYQELKVRRNSASNQQEKQESQTKIDALIREFYEQNPSGFAQEIREKVELVNQGLNHAVEMMEQARRAPEAEFHENKNKALTEIAKVIKMADDYVRGE